MIGRAPGVENLVLATGRAMLGITLAPVTGEIVADLVAGEPPRHALEPFRPGRFRAPSDRRRKMQPVTQPDFGAGAATLADRAYVRLREEIIRVELPPGTLLRDDDLMARMGIGRTPVREAVQRLRSDGFVTILPRRGTLVAEINITDLAAIYEVRRGSSHGRRSWPPSA